MSAPRVTRGGAAADAAARKQQQRREERDERARQKVRGGVAEVELAVDSDDDVDELLTRGGDNLLRGARHASNRCGDVLESMDIAIDTLMESVRAHLVRQDDKSAPMLRAQLREVLVAKQRLEAQKEALDSLATRGLVGGPIPAGGAPQELLVAPAQAGAARVPAFRVDEKLRPTDWRALVDRRVSVRVGPLSGFNPDKGRELKQLDKLGRIANVKLHPDMKSDSDDDSDDDGGGGGGGGGNDSDDSDIRMQAAPRRGAVPGVNNVVCPYTQLPLAQLKDPVIDSRDYVYEREAVERAVATYSRYGGQGIPHPMAGVSGMLTLGELKVAQAVLNHQGRGQLAKFKNAVKKCEKAGATAAAILERQQREARDGAAARAAKKKAAGTSGAAEVVNVGDSSDEEMEEAGGKGKKAAAKKKAAASPPARGGRLQTKAAAAAAAANKKCSDSEEESEEAGLTEDVELPEVALLDSEDDEAAAAAEYVRMEDEDDEDEGGRSDEGGGGGGRGGGRRPQRAAAAAGRGRTAAVVSSETETDEDEIEASDSEAAKRGGRGGDDDSDEVLSA